MVVAHKYDLQTQAKIPLALAALHNSTHILDPMDNAETEDDYSTEDLMNNHSAPPPLPIDPTKLQSHITQEEKIWAGKMRDDIAKAVWDDYWRELAEWGELWERQYKYITG